MRKLSIVIPTYNRIERLKKVLAALEQQECGDEPFEVIVVSDGSKDGTNEFLQNYPADTRLQLRAVFQANQGVATARNSGTKAARGELVLFIDDDVVPAPCLVSEHLRLHAEQGDKVVVLGPMLTPKGYQMHPWVEWEQRQLEKQYHAMVTGVYEATNRQFFTGNTSLGRKYLIESGGFDPTFTRTEDVELAYRLSNLGLRFIFNPEARGYHYADRTYASWSRTPYLYGKNDVIFSLQKQHRWLLPQIFREYGLRHPLIRALTLTCIGRPRLSRLLIGGMEHASRLFYRVGSKKLSMSALSGIFNLLYYQGVAEELGAQTGQSGRAAFLNFLKYGLPGLNQAVARSEK